MTTTVSGSAISTATGTFTGLVDISAAGAGQIQFPATQNASSNANTLDDYEEGTWTPTPGGGLTIVGTPTYTCTYTKIGRYVFLEGIIHSTTSLACAAGQQFISAGFPYTNAGVSMGGITNANANVVGTSWTYTPASGCIYSTLAISATTDIYFTLSYRV